MYTKALFYALVAFLKKWAKFKNNIPIRRKKAYINANKPARALKQKRKSTQ
jgi:hypothetical protein